MQIAATKNLILTGCSSYGVVVGSEIKVGRNITLLQSLLNDFAHTAHSRQSFQNLARGLIKVAEHAYSLRDMRTVEEAGRLLDSIPLADTRCIGAYYQALNHKRKGEVNKARALSEIVANQGPIIYKARAIQTLGVIHHEQGQISDALNLHLEALRVASSENNFDALATLRAHMEVSFIKSDNDDHFGALRYLENLLPLVRYAARQYPLYHYFYHADLAFELAQVGRIAEAEAAIGVALNSPFAAAYPEWSETRDEIASRRQAETRSPSIFIERACPALSPRSQSGLDQRQPPLSLIWLAYNNRAPQVSSQVARRAYRPSFHLTLLHRLHKRLRPRSPPALS
jgi:tetratricopeptide (TPR) repeat protein